MYNISKAELKATNNLSSDTIKIGQQLVVVSDKKLEEKLKKIEPEPKLIEVKPEPKPIEIKPEVVERTVKSSNVAKEHIYYTLKNSENIDSVCKNSVYPFLN